jgi:hypothetical protein
MAKDKAGNVVGNMTPNFLPGMSLNGQHSQHIIRQSTAALVLLITSLCCDILLGNSFPTHGSIS